MTSKIPWTDESWNPTVGCSPMSPGCDNCFAEAQAARLPAMMRGRGAKTTVYDGLVHMTPTGPRWTGEVRCIPERLEKPTKWRRPRKVFVDSMSDLFHDRVPNEFRDKVFAVMARCGHHSFQILTKRPGLAHRYLTEKTGYRDTNSAMHRVGELLAGVGKPTPPWQHPNSGHGIAPLDIRRWHLRRWPLPNVWIGVTVEGPEQLDRIEVLKTIPAALRFVSFEPLLARVDPRPEWATEWIQCPSCEGHGSVPAIDGSAAAAPCECEIIYASPGRIPKGCAIDWVIVGAEKAEHPRPMNEDWVRDLRNYACTEGVPFFYKQRIIDGNPVEMPVLDGRTWAEFPIERDTRG